jgi:hypothetical protein
LGIRARVLRRREHPGQRPEHREQRGEVARGRL